MIGRSELRAYKRSHPWITFEFDLKRLDCRTWLLLGEADSKCEHVAGAPLQPTVARRLHEIYLSKGVHGTTSIEGNTLSESEILSRVQGVKDLPPSRAYLGIDADNIISACNAIMWDIHEGATDMTLTPERIAQFNKQVLAGLDLDDDVVPGAIRQHSVAVARYRGAPAEDCDYLLERLCDWLSRDFVTTDEPMRFTVALLKAIFAHLYLAWIHPFGDGNGRTARLVEFQLLVQAGIPSPAAHLLSDHYNRTRDGYYRELDRTSKPPYPIENFVHYAVRGFVDELHSQINEIREQQMRVTWEHYVHTKFHNQETKARIRQHLVLDLPTDVVTAISSSACAR